MNFFRKEKLLDIWKVASSGTFWTALATFVIAIFTGGLLYYSNKQWASMDNQLRIMDNQLSYTIRSGKESSAQTDNLVKQAIAQANAAKATAEATKDIAVRTLRQAEATNRLAEQAKRSADIADNALRINQELAILDRRPWVGFNFIDNTTESGGYLRPYLVGNIANTGKTPAVDMTRNMFLAFRYHYNYKGLDINSISKDYYTRDGFEFPTPEPIVIDNIMDTNRYDNSIFRIDDVVPVIRVVPPNSIREFPVMQGFQFKLLNQKNTDPYNRKGVFIYVVGEITYYDTSRTWRYTTEFCIERNFEDDHTRFRPCAFGNDMK